MKKSLSLKNWLVLILLLEMPAFAGATSLTDHLYLSIPWGKAIRQVGHALPKKETDEPAAGPSGFSVDSQGRVGLLDIQNDRVQFWGRDQRLLQTIPCSRFSHCPDSVAADSEGQWYFSADHSIFKLRQTQNHLEGPRSFLELSALGIHSPNEIEEGADRTLFVNDNDTFTTYQLSSAGKVMASFPGDARWFAMASQGFWAKHADALKEYFQRKDTDVMILGISNGDVLVVCKEPQTSPKALHLDGWTLDGRKAFSISLSGVAAQLLDPARLGEIRPARVGGDGAIYAMGEPDSDAFRIYRFVIGP